MEDSAMAKLGHEDLFVVRNLSSSFPEAALLCDAFNGLTFSLEYGDRRIVVRKLSNSL
jgi:hypothetical protein